MRRKLSQNKVALVTGAGRRLGRQIALALAQDGFDIVVNYFLSAVGAGETVKEIQSVGRKAIKIKADISKRDEVQKMIATILKIFGRIDVLVNNSAVFIKSPLNKTTDEIWDKTLNTNLKGTFLCSQAVAKRMLKQKSGRIINISSLGGIQAWKEYLPYSVSKAGVVMLTRILAKTLAPYIYVNTIAPGIVVIKGEETTNRNESIEEKILLRKYGTPKDITELVCFLASKSEYITGQVFAVDGGVSIV